MRMDAEEDVMGLSDQAVLTWIIWAAAICAMLWALFAGRLELAFVAAVTLGLSMLPVVVSRYAGVAVPRTFMAFIVLFIFATLFLGESLDFYNRFWWWDMAVHGLSAIGFGIIGFLAVFMMFQGDRYSAPHFAVALFGFCFALAIGTLWEIFEFGMDQIFGLNMQKSGLMDTMSDLIVDALGALLGAASGYIFLKKRGGMLSGLIEEFVSRNPRFYGRARKGRPTDTRPN
jgi:hypothetical protein